MDQSQFQHHVPKFYLRGWSTTVNGVPQRVWVYEKGKEPRPSAIRRTGGRNNTYSLTRQDGSVDLKQVEEYLGRIESQAGKIFPKILQRELLTYNEKRIMSVFLSVMYRRDTYTLDAFAPEKLPAVMADVTAKMHAQIDAASVSDEVKERYRSEIDKVIEHYRNNPNEITSKAILEAEPYAEAVLQRLNWSFACSRSNRFVTSDSPIVFDRFRGINHPAGGHMIFPISSGILLWMTRWPIFLNSYFEISDDLARKMNARIIFNAHRQVYANFKSDEIKKFVDEFIAAGLPRAKSNGTAS